MNDKQIIRIEELKMAALNIQNKKDSIISIYETTIKKILYQSEECIIKSGKDYNDVIDKFKDLFLEFDTSVTELTDVLLNKVIPNYEDLVSNISRNFNAKFASEIKKALELEGSGDE